MTDEGPILSQIGQNVINHSNFVIRIIYQQLKHWLYFSSLYTSNGIILIKIQMKPDSISCRKKKK